MTTVNHPDAVEAAMALLSEQLHTTEVVMSVDEFDALQKERCRGADDIESERGPRVRLTECCERCGAPIRKNDAGFFVHAEPTNDCAVPTIAFRESRL